MRQLTACLLTVVVAWPAGADHQPPPPRPTEARPLLLGNWADPTILKDGDDYYMTHSSFEFQPGLLLWHSKDLRTWKPIVHAVNNQEGSIWAPELIKHEGRYYIYYPAAGKNWVVTADRIGGPWSKPVPVAVGRIDPGHIVGPDGKRYLHLSGGHAVQLTADGLKAVTPSRRVYEGWPIPRDWAIECFCLESPKLTRRGDWYYLTSAQGGTSGPSTSHMVVSARSKSPLGPWENSPQNPVIRTWSRDEPWWSKGHGTLVEGPDRNWYCVLHGYKNGQRPLGRCTLIEPIEWTPAGWFRVPDRWPPAWDREAAPQLQLSDDFDGKKLGLAWQFHRRHDASRFHLADGVLTLRGRGEHAGTSEPLSVMAMHPSYVIETEVELTGDGAAGIMLFGSGDAYIGLALTPEGKLRRVQEGFRRYRNTDEPTVASKRMALRIVNEKQDVRFYYKVDDGSWTILQPSMDVSSMTTVGWHALRPALFATGKAEARFFHFRYDSRL